MANTEESRNSILDWNLIEQKWIKKWEEGRVFEVDPDRGREKYFVTVAYPYPNSPQHIGHGRTYTLADAHARYMRMRGYNVLFPMGFHYTGTPILAMSRRVAEKDADLIETFKKIYHLSDDVIGSFTEPVKIASYFHNEIKAGMKEMGYSIDWRREFTTIDYLYSKFISWQFRTLQKKGLVVQGSHPVGWCPKDQNPVSQHDTIGDVEPDFNEYTVIKFSLIDKEGHDGYNGTIMPTATLRPETIFGVTNLWINPEIEYVIALIDSEEKWLVTREAARKLEFLGHNVSVESAVRGDSIVGMQVKNPINLEYIYVYPALFIQPDSGTGIVMSVPAHAPYDYQALIDLQAEIKAHRKYQQKFPLANLRPVKIIESDGIEGAVIPAEQVIIKYGIKSQEDPRLEKATNELYSQEFYKGRMMPIAGNFSGMAVTEAKESIKKHLTSMGYATFMFELINKPVRCRCGAECIVKLLTDQWFLNYSDKSWKELAHECANNMDIIPDDIRREFDYVIDWLRERACARKSGLGTKLPWDQAWIIESLSDSVIYMAYYIISKYVNNLTLTESDIVCITDTFFDYVLLGKGTGSQVTNECGIAQSKIEQIRDEFCHFYPVDSRHSGRDLVPNHLSFFIFNHVAIFQRENWPKQIVVNGSVLMEGKKMSKSLGNIIPLRDAIKEHGADPIRLAVLVSAEILQDADFTFDTVRGIRSKLLGIYEMADDLEARTNTKSLDELATDNEHRRELEDRWLISRLQRVIAETSSSMERLRVREAIHSVLYSLDQDLQWYTKRVKAKCREESNQVASTLKEFLSVRTRLLSPFAPFIAEEVWQKVGYLQHASPGISSILGSGWPEANDHKIDPAAEESELLVMNLLCDMLNIIRVTKMTPSSVIIYVSASWKRKIYNSILSNLMASKSNFGEIMKKLLADPETANVKRDPILVKKMIDDILSSPFEARTRRSSPTLAYFDEVKAIKDAEGLLSTEIGEASVKISIYLEDDSKIYNPGGKAKSARPFKPAVYME